MYPGATDKSQKSMHRLLISILTMSLIGPIPAYANTPDVEAAARQLLDAGAVGFSMALVDRDGIYWSEAHGYSDLAGRKRQYSNIAYGLAGYLVEVLSGEPLNRFSAEKIFKPLGMTGTGWMLSEIDTRQHAQLYELGEAEGVLVDWYGLATWPDGGVRTSVRDLSRFFAAMIGGGELKGTRILQATSVKAMFQPQFESGQVLQAVEDSENEQQAKTWVYRTGKSGKTVVGHSGGDPGVSTHAYFYPDAGVGAILLVNTSSDSEAFGLAVGATIKALLNTSNEKAD